MRRSLSIISWPPAPSGASVRPGEVLVSSKNSRTPMPRMRTTQLPRYIFSPWILPGEEHLARNPLAGTTGRRSARWGPTPPSRRGARGRPRSAKVVGELPDVANEQFRCLHGREMAAALELRPVFGVPTRLCRRSDGSIVLRVARRALESISRSQVSHRSGFQRSKDPIAERRVSIPPSWP